MKIDIHPPGEHGCNCPLLAGDPEKEGTWCILGLGLKCKGFYNSAWLGPDCPGPGSYEFVPEEEAKLLRELAQAVEDECAQFEFPDEDRPKLYGALTSLREWRRLKEELNAKKA